MATCTLLSSTLAEIAVVALETLGEIPFLGKELIAILVREAPATFPVGVPAVPGVKAVVPIFAVQSTPSSRAKSLDTTTNFAVIMICRVSTSNSSKAFSICEMLFSVS